jgi:cysteinyl-tRNA synthetase
MPLTLYNTLTRRKEAFTPLHEGHVGMYVCGPTVYGHSHIGHAKSYVSFDIIVRWLRHSGYKVTYVQNITDVGHLLGDTNEGEDRLLKQGRLEQKHPMEIAEAYTRSYFEDMDTLGVLRPDISPRATGHIIEQIELIKILIEKGYAYEADGSIYFNVGADKEYGKLSGRSTEEVESGTRILVKGEKRHPNDFALWKKAEPEHLMRWPSPWSIGFPGWHVECSAMSMKYLGETFDIHGGGMDNQFPHHECEIAQSESATGKAFVRYWVHNNLVTVNGQKMSKSIGNVILLKDAFKKWKPAVIRFFILQSHYRSTLDFSNDAIEGAAKGFERLVNTVRNLQEKQKSAGKSTTVAIPALEEFRSNFVAAMNDDFNAPQAIAVLFDLSREVNQVLAASAPLDGEEVQRIVQVYRDCGEILGLNFLSGQSAASGDAGSEQGMMDLILSLRQDIRAQKLWPLSDKIRDGLAKLGIVLEDRKDGTSWKRVS